MYGKKKIRSECDFIGLKNNRLNYRCEEWGRKCSKLINEATKNFRALHQFWKGGLNKFVLLLRKGAYPYDYVEGLMKHHYQIKKLSSAN